MKWPYLLVTIVYCAGIWWLSSQPNPPKPEIHFPGDDKVIHAILFGGLAAVVALGMRRSVEPLSPALLFWLPVLFALLYGIVDEIHQSFVPGRSPSVADIVADTTGALLVQTATRLYRAKPRPQPTGQ